MTTSPDIIDELVRLAAGYKGDRLTDQQRRDFVTLMTRAMSSAPAQQGQRKAIATRDFAHPAFAAYRKAHGLSEEEHARELMVRGIAVEVTRSSPPGAAS